MLYVIQAGLLESTEQLVKEIMAMEQSQVWTQNDHYLTDSRQKFLDRLLERLYGASLHYDDENRVTGVFNVATSYLAQLGLSREDLMTLVAKKRCTANNRYGDVDADLLDKIAGTLAYFKVASKRVYDYVPMHIKHYLLGRYCEQLEKLPVQLATATPGSSHAAADATEPQHQECMSSSAAMAAVNRVNSVMQLSVTAEELMEEEGSTAELRANLQKQLAQLISVRQILKVF